MILSVIIGIIALLGILFIMTSTRSKQTAEWCDPIKIHVVSSLGAYFRTAPRRTEDTQNGILKQGVKVCVLRLQSVSGYEKSWAYVKLDTGGIGWVSSENLAFSPY